jgi:hypothetical protein
MWMRDATRREKLPTVQKLINPRFFPYRYGQSLWAYITGRWGDTAVAKIMKAVSKTGDYKPVIKKVLGVSLEQLSKDWHNSMKNAYSPLTEVTEVTDKSSRLLFKATKEIRLNVSPALSPDGNQIVFLSSRDLFSIDMYLADARTGEILPMQERAKSRQNSSGQRLTPILKVCSSSNPQEAGMQRENVSSSAR